MLNLKTEKQKVYSITLTLLRESWTACLSITISVVQRYQLSTIPKV